MPHAERADAPPDGRFGAVEFRPIRPDDALELIAFHGRLSPESQYLRFFTAHPRLTAPEVTRFTSVDGHERIAIVAVLGGRIAGVARADRTDGGTAEVAVVVEDAVQHHGLGSALLDRVADEARSVGMDTFEAEVLPTNRRMLDVFHHLGFPVTSRFGDGVVHLSFPIAPVSPYLQARAERESTTGAG